MSERKCSVEGCERELKPPCARGLCSMHYQRWRKTGATALKNRTVSRCSVEGCKQRYKSNGYCSTHYQRWRKNGEPLTARKRGAEGKPLALLLDVAKSRPRGCVFWPYGKDSKGYGSIIYQGRRMQAGRAMCLEIHGPPPFEGAQAAHRCGNGNKGCYGPDCMYWATAKQNTNDKRHHGTLLTGERHPMAVVTEEVARSIMTDARSSGDLSRVLGISRGVIKSIRSHATWSHVTAGLIQPKRVRRAMRGEKNGSSKLCKEQVLQAYRSTLPARVFAERFGVSRATIEKIRNGKLWHHVTRGQ
jgi:hypothetical protein